MFTIVGCASGGNKSLLDAGIEKKKALDTETGSDIVRWDPESLPKVTLSAAEVEKNWVTIPATTFIYGAPESTPCCYARQQQVEVTITRPFKMAATEITRAQWRINGFPDHPSNAMKRGCDDCPITYVSWFDIFAWLNTLSRAAGLEECYDLSSCTVGDPTSGCPEGEFFQDQCIKEENDTEVVLLPGIFICTQDVRKYATRADCRGYRLPTVAEWELAARGKTTTLTYNGDLSGSKDSVGDCHLEPNLEPIAWYCNNAPNQDIQPVGQLRPNAYGLYDMLGNAAEFVDHIDTGSALQAEMQKEAPLIDPSGISGYRKYYFATIRGGGPLWWPLCDLTAVGAYPYPGEFRNSSYSFRPVRTIHEGEIL